MCGICGEIRLDGAPPDAVAVLAMANMLRPRGPDASGSFSQDRVAFGHRRLSILDLSPASQQPMVDPELGLALVFNGCIYNFQSLRQELQAKGYCFFSDGDTEVIIKAYHAWGPRCVERFLGMFAFAIYERGTRRVVLARDRLGIKPLYLADTGKGLRFASTLPALLTVPGIDTSIDPVALHHYMSFHAAVPAPMTILNGIRKLPPATTLWVEADGRRSERVYWQVEVNERPEDRTVSQQQWVEAVRAKLWACGRRRTVADGPTGALRSGGLDSSLVVALLAENNSTDIKTFAVGFDSVGDVTG